MRTMMLRGTLLLAGLLSLSAPPALAQNLVKGTVVDAQNKPVDGATIHFEATKFVNKRDTKTDRKGTFLFQGLQSGEYTVTASKDGVGTQTKTVHGVLVIGARIFDFHPCSGCGRYAGDRRRPHAWNGASQGR